MNKEITCRQCCDLLPDYEWLDIENKKIVEEHTENCQNCSDKKNMILGKFPQEGIGGLAMIDKIDFTDNIMQAIADERQPVTNPFLYRILGVLVALELIMVYFSGFSGFQEGFSLLQQLYQYLSEITLPALDESLGLYEEVSYLSIPTEYLPGNFMAILFFSGVTIAAALFFVSRKRSATYGS